MIGHRIIRCKLLIYSSNEKTAAQVVSNIKLSCRNKVEQQRKRCNIVDQLIVNRGSQNNIALPLYALFLAQFWIAKFLHNCFILNLRWNLLVAYIRYKCFKKCKIKGNSHNFLTDKIKMGTEIRTWDLLYSNPLSNRLGHNPNCLIHQLNIWLKANFFPSLGKKCVFPWFLPRDGKKSTFDQH